LLAVAAALSRGTFGSVSDAGVGPGQSREDTCGRCGAGLLVLLTFCPGCGLLEPLCPSCITAHVAELAEQAGRPLGD
jgi:hypothetical protein